MGQRLRILAGLCLISISWSALACATLVEYLSPQQLGARSELVVRGRVESSDSYWNDKHTKIFTRTRISVGQTYKGIASAYVDIVQIGGIVGNVKVTAHGALRWNRGDEVLLFAEPDDAGSYRVSGFSQGRFMIERHPDTGEPFILAPRQDGVQILGAPAVRDNRFPQDGIPLDEFVSHALDYPSTKGVAR